MCDGGSSNPLKDPLYWMVKQDSRGAAELGRAIGWNGLRDEGKYNQKNPGHAITKAAEYAALYGIGDYLAGAGEAGGAFDGATAGAEGGAEQLAAQEAAAQLAQQAPQGLANTMESGLTDTGYTPSSLWHAVNNPNATATSAVNRGLGTSFSGGGGGASSGKMMAAQQGLKMMFPEQQQQQRPAPMAMQGQQGPLPDLYARDKAQARPMGAYGTPAGNSLGFTEEQKKKLRDMGYQI